nr:PREDICTED: RAS protein activator like-3 isoform X1 [Lepisosteus oculatus]
MGTSGEMEVEQAEPETPEDSGSLEKAPSTPSNPGPPEPSDDASLLRTYKWHTGVRSPSETAGAPPADKGASGSATAAQPSKWSRMQWRKAHSEDPQDRVAPPSKPEDAKGDKPASAPRKNPFRRALSEPPGALFSTAPAPARGQSPPAEGRGSPALGPQQKGALFRKYLRSVSQKFKKPRAAAGKSGNSATCSTEDTSTSASPSAAAPTAAPFTRISWTPQPEVPFWDISCCALTDGQIMISRDDEAFFRTVNRMSGCQSTLSLQNLTDSHGTLDQAAPVGQRSKGPEGGVKAMIIRRLRPGHVRKSSTQLNRQDGHCRTSLHDSRESLAIPVSAADSLDLSSDQTTVVRPVHSSILGEKYCFEVINSEGSHCFGCSSAAERDRWIENLRRAAQPNKDNCARTENALSLWVNEAKDLPAKKRYYCELHLDGTLYARTTSRSSAKRTDGAGGGGVGGAGGGGGGGQLFWGELFELDNLPPVSQLTLHLFREEDSKKKSSAKDDVLCPLGSVGLPLSDITGRAFQERWYPILPCPSREKGGGGSSGAQLGAQASVRIKARYQNLHVLPIERYKEFAEYITFHHVELCTGLEPLLSVREKEELAGALVHVLQSIGKAKEFLTALGAAELQRCGEKEALIFRENTLATKAIDEYMKLVGQKYLIDTLGEFIAHLYGSGNNWEVDPQKCSPSELQSNQKNLREGCEEAFQRITETYSSFPVELNEIFSAWREECEVQGRGEIAQRLISASLFLRFLCPAIMSPSLFGLTQAYPDPGPLRALTLTAKVIQNLANFTPFGDKEEYMLFMNDFLEQHWERMGVFLGAISNPDSEVDMARFDGYVDLPLRLCVLHGLLTDIIAPMEQHTIDGLHPLPSILNAVADALGPSASRIAVSSLITEHSKPTYVPPRELSSHSPLHASLLHLEEGRGRGRAAGPSRKRVQRTQSVPDRIKHQRRAPLRQASTENLSPEMDVDRDPPRPFQISEPEKKDVRGKIHPAPVPWIKDNKESSLEKTEHEEFSLLEKHDQEISELRQNVDLVTERDLELAKRLEDFIAQSQDQNALLQTEVQELKAQLATKEEELASATFRLGVIEEEREEDQTKLSVAMAAAERMDMLERQFADLMNEVMQLREAENRRSQTASLGSEEEVSQAAGGS